MIITCPNCATKYNVQPALIGNGRSARCYNCGHMWYQAPVISPPPMPQPQPQMAPPAMAPQPQMAAYPQAPAGQPMAYPQPTAYPQHMAHPHMAQASMPAMADAGTAMPGAVMPMQAPAAPVPEPAMESPPEPEPDPEPDDPLDDFDLDSVFDDDEKEAPALDGASEADDDQNTNLISDADLDEMFGEDDEDVEPMTSIMDNEEDDEPVAADIDPEDLPDPDPVPQMFTSEEADDADVEKRSLGKLIGIGAAVFLVALLAVLFFARGMVMDMLPFTKGLYDMAGLSERIGAGLNLSKPKIDYDTETETGKPILVVQGVITNVLEESRTVPMLKVILRDANKQDIQTKEAPPLRNALPGGERMRYKITVVDPSPLARSIAVIFVNPEDVKQKPEDIKQK